MVSLNKGHCLFLRRKMRQRELTKFLALKYGKRSPPCHFNLYMTKFQQVFAGRAKCSGGQQFAHPCFRLLKLKTVRFALLSQTFAHSLTLTRAPDAMP